MPRVVKSPSVVVKQCRAEEPRREYGVEKEEKEVAVNNILDNGVRAGRKPEGMGKGQATEYPAARSR